MPVNKDFYSRLSILDSHLRNHLRNWTLQDLIDGVNERLIEDGKKPVSKRTIQNDLQFLINEKGAPIEKKRSGGTIYFFYVDKKYSFVNLPITDEEVSYLKDAIEILRQVNDFKILKDVDYVINKLQNTIVIGQRDSSFIQFEKHTIAIGTEHIETFFTAIKERLTLRVSYQSFKTDVASEFVFHPYLLKEYRNRWFVIGTKEMSNHIIVLALDRIKNIRNSSVSLRTIDTFDPATFFKDTIGVSIPSDASPEIVEIRVLSDLVPYVLTKPIHHSQKVIKNHKNGDVSISLQIICNYELLSILLGFGNQVVVEKPPELRDLVVNSLRRSLKNYK